MMFVDGSLPRDMTTWTPASSGYFWANTGSPIGAFHARGKAANLVACDGHAETFKDFMEYEKEVGQPYIMEGGGEEGNLYYYFLPMYWYKTDASTRLRQL